MMRILFLLILIGGLALGIAYPWAVQNASGREIGAYMSAVADSSRWMSNSPPLTRPFACWST